MCRIKNSHQMQDVIHIGPTTHKYENMKVENPQIEQLKVTHSEFINPTINVIMPGKDGNNDNSSIQMQGEGSVLQSGVTPPADYECPYCGLDIDEWIGKWIHIDPDNSTTGWCGNCGKFFKLNSAYPLRGPEPPKITEGGGDEPEKPKPSDKKKKKKVISWKKVILCVAIAVAIVSLVLGAILCSMVPTITTTTDCPGAGTYTHYQSKLVWCGGTKTLTAKTNPGYTWCGWYDGAKELSKELEFSYTMPNLHIPRAEITITAKWEKCTNNHEDVDSVWVCEKCGWNSLRGQKVGKEVKFGLYPQSLVEDESTLVTLNDNEYVKKSENWKQDGSVLYCDVTVDDKKYRGVHIGVASIEQLTNEFKSETTYWFLWEPVWWVILDTNEEEALLLPSLILDARGYKDINNWLNGAFLQDIFDSNQQKILSGENGDNGVFLLSEEQTKSKEINDFCRKGSDFAKGRGLYVFFDNEWINQPEWNKKSAWWLQSDDEAKTFLFSGAIGTGAKEETPSIGVCPAIRVKIR